MQNFDEEDLTKQDKPQKLYMDDPAPHEEHFELHQRCRLKVRWTDLFRALVGQRLMISICMRLIVIKDENGKFLDMNTDMWSSRTALVPEDEDPDTVDAKFSHNNYDKLHSKT